VKILKKNIEFNILKYLRYLKFILFFSPLIINAVGNKDFIYSYIIGKSVEGRPIWVSEIGKGEEVIVIFGVFHGDEPQGKVIIEELKKYLINNPEILKDKKVVLVPVVNPDGLVRKSRLNANNVDINRNFPTKDWNARSTKKRCMPGSKPASEPETRAVITLLDKYKPLKIISIHSPMRCINYDGPAKEIAIEMAKYNKYPVKTNIGYETPGSFGTYAGKEKSIPTITLEVSAISGKRAWAENKDALIAAIKFNPSKGILKHEPDYFIKVVKSEDKLYLYKAYQEDTILVKSYPISTGFNSLPYNGIFRIIFKQKISGWEISDSGWVFKGGDSKTKEFGPYYLGINSWHKKTKRNLGIHGTDRDDLIGKKVSKDCIRMRNKDIEELYHTVSIGTLVIITD
jgi:protein MpaA